MTSKRMTSFSESLLYLTSEEIITRLHSPDLSPLDRRREEIELVKRLENLRANRKINARNTLISQLKKSNPNSAKLILEKMNLKIKTKRNKKREERERQTIIGSK